MASNDEVLVGIPNIFCPSCRGMLYLDPVHRIDKYSKAQRLAMRRRADAQFHSVDTMQVEAGSGRNSDQPWPEDRPNEYPERNFQIVSCPNSECDQYNKFKVLRVPRIKVVSARVDLGGE